MVHKPVTDQEPEETQTKSSQKEPTPFLNENTGSNNNNITNDMEPSFISEVKDQLKGSAGDKDNSSLPHPSRLYYNYNLVFFKLLLFSVSIICRVYDNDMKPSV